MFRNYLLIAWRNLAKQRVLSFINIFGLSLGIACFSLFLLYALNEFSFDSFHENARNLYRAYNDGKVYHKGQATGNMFTPLPLGPAMKEDLPGVADYTRFAQSFETYIRIGNNAKRELIAFADPSFFHMFSFRFKEGSPSSALTDMHSLVLTEETAHRMFGNEDPVGKQVQIQVLGNAFETFTVSAVAEDIPANSSIGFNMLGNFAVIPTTEEGKGDIGNWDRNSFQTFIQLQPGSQLAGNQPLLTAFKQKYRPVEKGAKPDLFALEPLREMHTDTGFGWLSQFLKVQPVERSFVWILISIATGVLLISCINFTTLSVGRSANRAKEVGVRKAIGGGEGSLRRQFLTEAFLMTCIAFILGAVLAVALLPFFNEYAGRELSFSVERYPALPLMYAGMIASITFLSGGYPAWMLSRFKAVDVLKSKLTFGGSNGFTKTLVTLQFVLSLGLIIGAVVMVQQLHYMQSRNPGFAKENVVQIEAQDIPDSRRIYTRFKQGLAGYPEVLGEASADNGLGDHEGIAYNSFEFDKKSVSYYPFLVDQDYVSVLGMQVVAGRNLSAAFASDTLRSVLINEAMAKALGWTPATAVGHQLKGLQSADSTAPPTVVGVVKDINFLAMDQAVQPQLFHAYDRIDPYHFFVRISPGDPSTALNHIEKAWKEAAPGYAFRYNFVDESLDRFYTNERRLSHIISWAAGISILLACMGLLGLALLATLNRTKEIGIRKVLGASVQVIIKLIARDFIRLILLAFLIATPIAWYVMHRWLDGYYYRVTLAWWVFAAIGAGILGMAWLTVAVQAYKAARANPVKSLRAE